MASAIVLGAPARRSRREPPPVGTCRCSYNPRTKRTVESCYLGKARAGNRSGWKFTKGGGSCSRRG